LTLDAWDTVVTTGTTGGGERSVTITAMPDRQLFLAAAGTVTEGGPLPRGATRRIGDFSRLFTSEIDPPAAVTVRGGFTANGAPNKVDGSDRVPPDWSGDLCPFALEDKPGVVTDDASAIQTSGGGGGRGRGGGGGGGGGCPSQISGTPC